MVDKLIDTAMLFKAKIKNDELEGLLIEATSQDNWQTPTNILHKIANASYNQDDWKRILDFIVDKLKGKKWKKVLKSLSLTDFILKNGSSAAVEDIKSELYLFKTFDTFSCVADGVDRSEAIRQKSKAVVEMLVNSELLEEERIKANNIKEKMGLSNSYSNARYDGPTKMSAGSPYQGMGSSGGYVSDSPKKQQPPSDSYTDKIKTGFNQVSDYIKSSYNKVNWNDVSGYIKDKVTNPTTVDHRNTLLTDEPGLIKKTSTDSNKTPSDYKPPSGTLFANLNVKKTTTSAIGSQKNLPASPTPVSSTVGNKPLLKPSTPTPVFKQPASKPVQQLDILSFDEDAHAAAKKNSDSTGLDEDMFLGLGSTKPSAPAAPVNDIFGDFGAKPVQQTTNSASIDHFDIFGGGQPAKPATNTTAPTTSSGNVFGDFNVNMISANTKPANNPPVIAQKPAVQAQTATNQKSGWLSQAQTNLIDFSDMSEPNNKSPQQAAPTQAPQPQMPQPIYNPMAQPAYNMMGYPQVYAQPAYPGYPAMQYPQPQVAIPANQYEQYQQFLLFQQQQQAAGLKGKN